MEEAKRMGLTLMDDPETLSNAPREHRHRNRVQRDDDRSKHLHGGLNDDNVDDDDDIDANDPDDAELVQYMLETGGLTDREIDRLDGKTSGRLHQKDKPSAAAAAEGESGAEGAGVTNKYPERDSGANTGPKGVLADQKYHQRQQLQERMAENQAYNDRMESKAMTTTTFRQDHAAETKVKNDLEKEHMTPEQRKIAEELEGDEDEKKILERIRGKRKTFGYLMEMNAAQYVTAIDSEKKDVTVVIHIYSDVSYSSYSRLCLSLLCATSTDQRPLLSCFIFVVQRRLQKTGFISHHPRWSIRQHEIHPNQGQGSRL